MSEEKRIYESIIGNEITLVHEQYDYNVYLNNSLVMTSGDEMEAEMIAESIDVALNLLYIQGRLLPQQI